MIELTAEERSMIRTVLPMGLPETTSERQLQVAQSILDKMDRKR